MIKKKWFTSDVAAFELGPPHAGPYPLDDQVALKFGDRPDDDHDRSSERSSGVDLLAGKPTNSTLSRFSSSSTSPEVLH